MRSFTRTARSLVLDTSDGSFLPPVDGFRQGLEIPILELLRGFAPLWQPVGLEPQELLLELVMAHVRKLVQPEPVVGDGLVPLVDVLQVILKDLEPMQLLLDGHVLLVMPVEPGLEETYELVDARQVFGRVAHDREVVGRRRHPQGDEDES